MPGQQVVLAHVACACYLALLACCPVRLKRVCLHSSSQAQQTVVHVLVLNIWAAVAVAAQHACLKHKHGTAWCIGPVVEMQTLWHLSVNLQPAIA
jgi:hypothetical protein